MKVIIVTEDSRSGKEFLNLLVKYIKMQFPNNQREYYVLDTGIICNTQSAGKNYLKKSCRKNHRWCYN